MQPAHNLLKKRGAMFGLDARIALAIFAGLATVTGASIYKLSSQSRVTAIVAELNNISKAFGDYIMDVGAPPDRIEDLITSTARGWNGPYVPYVDYGFAAGVDNLLYIDKFEETSATMMQIIYGDTSSWDTSPPGCSSADCAAWLFVSGAILSSEDLAEDLDMYFDKNIDFATGIFRCEPGIFPDGTCALKLGSVRQR